MKKLLFLLFFSINFFCSSAEMELDIATIDNELLYAVNQADFEAVKKLTDDASLDGLLKALKKAKEWNIDLNKSFEQGGLIGNINFKKQEEKKDEFPKIINFLENQIKQIEKDAKDILDILLPSVLKEIIYEYSELPKSVSTQQSSKAQKRKPESEPEVESEQEIIEILPSEENPLYSTPPKSKNIARIPEAPFKRRRIN